MLVTSVLPKTLTSLGSIVTRAIAIIHPNNRQNTPSTCCAGRSTFIPYNPLIHVKIHNNTVNIVRIEMVLLVLMVVSVSDISNRDSVFSYAMDTSDSILSVLYCRSSKYTSKSHS